MFSSEFCFNKETYEIVHGTYRAMNLQILAPILTKEVGTYPIGNGGNRTIARESMHYSKKRSYRPTSHSKAIQRQYL